MEISTFLIITLIAFSFYLFGSGYSFFQYKQRKKLHERNSTMLGFFFARGVDVRKFSLFTSAAMFSRALLFIIQYQYVSTKVDWLGFFILNCLEDIGYLLFITSYTILITFFGMLHTLARSGTNGGNSLNRHASSLSLRRTRQQQLQRSKKAGKDSDEHPFNNNATRDVANNNTFNYISDGGDDGHMCSKCNFVCMAFTANAWLFVLETIFLLFLLVTQDEKQGEVESWRRIFFSLFYIIYILQFGRIGYILRKILHAMQIDSRDMENLVIKVVFVCCLSLLLQIVSMLSRVAYSQTKSSEISHNISSIYYNMTIPGNNGNPSTNIETDVPSKYEDGEILSNRTVYKSSSEWIYTNTARSFDFGPLVFYLLAEWLPVMYILRIMAPVKPVTIEDILKDMRKKNKKKISQKNNTNKNGTVSAKMVELVERNKKENGEMKMEVGEKKDPDDDDGNSSSDQESELWL